MVRMTIVVANNDLAMKCGGKCMPTRGDETVMAICSLSRQLKQLLTPSASPWRSRAAIPKTFACLDWWLGSGTRVLSSRMASLPLTQQ